MISYVEALASDIAEAIAEARYLDDTLCEPNRVTVTAGEPAASTECEPAVWVWVDRVEDLNVITENECAVDTIVSLAYRIDVCYPETVEDQTDDEHLAPAECLYGLMDAIWLHLVALRDAGNLLGLEHCDDTALLPLVVGQRQGGTVSATGGVSFGYSV